MKQSCKSCEHFDSSPETSRGECRLKPPVIVDSLVRHFIKVLEIDPWDATEAVIYSTVFPEVYDEQVCGQYSKRL